MKIAPLIPYNIRNNTPINFKSSSRNVCDFGKGIEYQTTTCLFRDDVDWKNLVNILEKKFKKTDKVNVIIHACSSGEEALSFALRLDLILGNKAEKYYPIVAKDFDMLNIEMAKNGIFEVNENELNMLNKYTKSDNKDYEIVQKGSRKFLVTRQKGVIKNIEFSQADILKDINNIPEENTVLFCRNFWPYLKIEERNDMIKQLAKKLKPSSIVILGAFDSYYGIPNVFENEGFKKHANNYLMLEKLPKYRMLLKKLVKKVFSI